MKLTLKEIILQQIKDRVKQHNATQTTTYGTIIRPRREYGFKAIDFATLQIENPRSPKSLIKQFYLQNKHDPFPFRFRTQKFRGAQWDSYHTLFYRGMFFVTVAKGDNSTHNVRLWYMDSTRAHNTHWIGSTKINCEIFMNEPKITKRVSQCIANRSFQTAIHQLDKQIPEWHY